MPRNGNGSYSLPASSWNPAVDTTVIDSADWNTNVAADLEGALTQSISKDGQTPYTGNQPMGNNKLTGLAAGAVATDSVNLGQVQSGAYEEATAGGTADVITLAVSPVITAYAKGQEFWFTAGGTNTTNVTVNVSSVGAKALEANGVALVAGDIVSGEYYGARYDGTAFQLLTSRAGVIHTADIADGAVTSAKLNADAKTGAIRAVTGTTDTVLSTDRGKLVTYSNASPIAVTLPQATGSFVSPFFFAAQNLGAGVVTITPTTSTIDGAATLTLSQNQGVQIFSDSTNYNTQRGRTTQGSPYRAETAGTTVIASDNGGVINFTTAGVTCAFTAAATLGSSFSVIIMNTASSGDVTLDPDSTETLDGLTTRLLRPGDRATVKCTGAAFLTTDGVYSYDSGAQTVTTGGALTLAHGLGVVPDLNFECSLTNVTGEQNWTTGQVMTAPINGYQNSASNCWAFQPDATNLNLQYGSSAIAGINRTTGAAVTLTAGNWTFRVIARKRYG